MHTIISVPVADLRRKPEELLPKDFSHNSLRETQLLFNEEIRVLHNQGEWLFVEALNQPRFVQNKGWSPYAGWIHIRESTAIEKYKKPNVVVCKPQVVLGNHLLSYGTLLYQNESQHIKIGNQSFPHDFTGIRPIPTKIHLELLIEEAQQFLGTPYLWGGRGSYSQNPVAGFDCSSLIHLLFQSQGIVLPRDAHDQYLFCPPSSPNTLRKGDLIFLAPQKDPHRCTHVVLYHQKNQCIEAPRTGEQVKISHFVFLDSMSEKIVLKLEGRENHFFAWFGRVGKGL